MQKIVVREGDTVALLPALTPLATLVPPPPVPVPKGSAGFRVEGHAACVPDDIESMVINNVPYTTQAFPNAGSGRVQLTVPAQNRATYARTSHGTVEVVVNGGPLDLVFTVEAVASNPSGGADVIGTQYRGKATLTCPRTRPVTAG
ncbi:hypothetical protein GCM10010218_59540 [Streptomyces mashuensis]|uniref:Uncharacterized protein n=1 Tax=Streptomyces mashuensis TaxID=33904 RepID=A0A919B912_9ACTN|nr:hypothetical protein [Streptomyces mashuensis]GHF70275.1 hypothetical protein GCM10010218_59540 [Streptomyces mashuensis]